MCGPQYKLNVQNVKHEHYFVVYMDLHGKRSTKMSKNKTVIQSKEVTKNIINRLESNSDNIFLFDETDESYIAIDKSVIEHIKNYLELL